MSRRQTGGGDRDPVESLLGSIYGAALDASLWQDAIAQVAALCGGSAISLHSPGARLTDLLFHSHNLDPTAGLDYARHWYHKDEWDIRARRLHGLRAGSSDIGDLLIPPDEFRRTEFGHDFAHRYGFDQMLGIVLFDETTPELAPRIHITVFRDDRQPRFDYEQLERLRGLLPHFQRAARIHYRLQGQIGQIALSTSVLDALQDAAFLLAPDRRIAVANANAQRLLKNQCVIARNDRIEQLGRRSIPPVSEAVRMAAATGVVVDLVAEFADVVPVLTRASVHPLNADHALALSGAPSLLLLVQVPTPPARSTVEQVGRLYGFTPAEQRVLNLLVKGMTIGEIADSLTLQQATVKTHVRALLQKGGFRRSIDLVRELSALV